MENTLARFENQVEPKWYMAQGGDLLGPMSGKEIANWVTSKGISVAHYIWSPDAKEWRRIYEVPEFRALLPAEPTLAVKELALHKSNAATSSAQTPPSAPVPPAAERIWYVFTNNAQYGPFEKSEVEMMIESGRVDANSFFWKKGMADWQRATDSPDFKGAVAKSANKAHSTSKADQRHAPRRPFEAKILMTDGQEVGWALCRDVSIGGMQVLMDHAPGAVGSVLKINVSPADSIPAFSCEGTIVRILEDGRGFSFRFSKLPTDAREAIEDYVAMA